MSEEVLVKKWRGAAVDDKPRAGDEITVSESYSSPPAVSELTYVVTSVDDEGNVWGTLKNYYMHEFTGEDMR